MHRREWGGVAFAVLIFLLVQLGALALVPTFYEQGYQTVEDPTDPTNSLLYIGAILVATVVMLAAFKYNLDRLIRGLIVFTSGLLSWYVFGAVIPPALGGVIGAGPANLLSIALAGGVSVALLLYPEWYVIDTAGVLMGAGAAGLFGISFGLLPAIVLLTVLAVYDAISVYGTEHMLDLAEGVMNLKIPVVLVVPLTLSYSLLDEDFSQTPAVEGDDEDAPGGTDAGATESGGAAPEADGGESVADERDDPAVNVGGDGEFELGEGRVDPDDTDEPDRDAFFIGLGDAVMPTVMVASAAFFSPADPLGTGLLSVLNLPALLSMVGTFLGLLILLRMVFAGRAHAGLPLLNGGAITGYLLGSLATGVPILTALGL
ncbi:presenilin family intramembrane aspartyl protease PSH [Salinirubrum litoreum]|uniref:Presenilin family intramembrane aspartyl protease PSH n=1 Tax=Salinirubrum litoreum TaxID=1126234 RepID=A0ABD5R9Z1_9EURY|nr:presenilin family intramembrane aspartyl protease PSH [Salinirubrum litoreum]